LSDVRDGQLLTNLHSVHNGDVPGKVPPRDQSKTVWPLAIRADQPSWLFCHTSEGPVDQVIELLVAGDQSVETLRRIRFNGKCKF